LEEREYTRVREKGNLLGRGERDSERDRTKDYHRGNRVAAEVTESGEKTGGWGG
jgi:hypothetical protein